MKKMFQCFNIRIKNRKSVVVCKFESQIILSNCADGDICNDHYYCHRISQLGAKHLNTLLR
jgi:hypothetical protein